MSSFLSPFRVKGGTHSTGHGNNSSSTDGGGTEENTSLVTPRIEQLAALIFGNPDLMSIVAPFVGTENAFVFSLVCKGCHMGTAVCGIPMLSSANDFIQTEPQRRFLISQGYSSQKLMNLAARYGLVDVVQVLRARRVPWSEATCAAAAAGGHVHVLTALRYPPVSSVFQWIAIKAKKSHVCCPWNASVCTAAARAGHIAALFWLRSQEPPCPYDENTCAGAAMGGHMDVLLWLRNQTPPCSISQLATIGAAKSGHLSILSWCLERFDLIPHGSDKACVAAASEGHIDALRMLRNHQCPWSAQACAMAAHNGHLHMLQYLRSEVEHAHDGGVCPWDWYTAGYAAQQGHIDVLKWVLSEVHDNDPVPLLERCVRLAAAANRIDALEILRNGNNRLTRICPWDAYCCKAAAAHGHVEALRWLRSCSSPCPWNPVGCSYDAAAGGHIPILEYIRENVTPEEKLLLTEVTEAKTCKEAAYGGHIHVLKYLRRQKPPFVWDEDSCIAAAQQGHVETLKWLRSQTPPCPWPTEYFASSAVSSSSSSSFSSTPPNSTFTPEVLKYIEYELTNGVQ